MTTSKSPAAAAIRSSIRRTLRSDDQQPAPNHRPAGSRQRRARGARPARARREGPAGRRPAAARPHSGREGRGPGGRGPHRVATWLRIAEERFRADEARAVGIPPAPEQDGDEAYGLGRPISAISSLLIASQVDFVKLSERARSTPTPVGGHDPPPSIHNLGQPAIGPPS